MLTYWGANNRRRLGMLFCQFSGARGHLSFQRTHRRQPVARSWGQGMEWLLDLGLTKYSPCCCAVYKNVVLWVVMNRKSTHGKMPADAITCKITHRTGFVHSVDNPKRTRYREINNESSGKTGTLSYMSPLLIHFGALWAKLNRIYSNNNKYEACMVI